MSFNLKIDDIKYIKISYTDSDGSALTVKAAVKRIDNREILACAKSKENLVIQTPKEILLSIVCRDGLYKTKTVLKSISNDDPYVFWALELPENLEYQQNREYFRIPIDASCLCKVNGGFVEVRTIDLSANGVSVYSQNQEINNEVTIILKFEDRQIEAQVKKIRTEIYEDGKKISFQFVNIAENDRDFISQICLKKQLEDRRNSLL